MKNRTCSSILIIFLLAVIGTSLTNCSYWSPNARKQRYYKSALGYFEKQDYRAAAIQLQNALKIDPQFADAHYELSQCYERLGMWSGAFAELSRTVDLAPRNWKAQVDIGNLLAAHREYQRALDKAKLVLAANPQDVDAQTLLANASAGLGNSEGSLEEMKKAIQLAPDRSKSYLNLALLEINAKDIPAA